MAVWLQNLRDHPVMRRSEDSSKPLVALTIQRLGPNEWPHLLEQAAAMLGWHDTDYDLTVAENRTRSLLADTDRGIWRPEEIFH